MKLPRLYVIGDSISLHYGPYLQRFVEGRFAYSRKVAEPTLGSDSSDRPRRRTSGADAAGATAAAAANRDPSGVASSLDYPQGPFSENAGDSGMVLTYLRARPAAVASADVMVLNCGLHDLKIDRSRGAHQVPIEAYSENLERIVELTADAAARRAWCTITPVDDYTHAKLGAELSFDRVEADVGRYNAVATQVMQAAGVMIIDLHALTLALQGGGEAAEIYVDHVHFAPHVRAAQAAFIAGRLESL